ARGGRADRLGRLLRPRGLLGRRHLRERLRGFTVEAAGGGARPAGTGSVRGVGTVKQYGREGSMRGTKRWGLAGALALVAAVAEGAVGVTTAAGGQGAKA